MNKTIKIAFAMMFLWTTVGILSTVAQGGYGQVIADEHGVMRDLNIDDIVYHDDYIYVRGNNWIDSIGLWGLFVAKLDTNGTLLWHNTIYDTTKQSSYSVNTPTRFSFTEKGSIILPNYFFHRNNLALSVCDFAGNEIFTKRYSHDGLTIYPREVIKYEDYYYLFGRVQRVDYENDCYVMKVDSLGNQVWLKYYGLKDLGEGFGGVLTNKNGTFTISSYRTSKEFYLSGSTIVGWKSPWIFTIDTSGVIVDEWLGEENDTTTLGEGPIIRFPNGDLAVISRDFKVVWDAGRFTIWVSPTVTRLDSNFQLVWKRRPLGFENAVTFFKDMEYDSLRDELVICGHKQIVYSEDVAEWEIWIIKMKGNGDILWETTDTIFFGNTEGHVEAGLEIAPSGSIYVAGYVSHFGVSQGWIIKITPDGCSDTLCTTTSILEQIRNEHINVVLYPNPARDMLHVRIKSLPGDAYLRITDLQGRVLASHKVIEGENSIDLNLPSGMYICTIVGEGKMVYSGKVVVR